MLTCLSSFMREISRIAVDGVPSSASRWISFRATISLVVLDLPLKTVAYVPSPVLMLAGEDDGEWKPT